MPAAAQAENDHAALMDRVYRRQRHIYDFTRKYYLFGRDRLLRTLAARPGERVVEVGCGTARNLILAARLHPGVSLYGIDISSEMLKSARAAVAAAGLSGRINLAQGSAENLEPAVFGEERPFDHVIFPYSLSMIPQWKQALAAAGRAVGPAGQIHLVDFGDLTGLGPLGAAALRRWLAIFHVSPREELLEMFESVAKKPFSGMELTILPGRYAFLLRGDGKLVAGTAAGNVAG